MLGGTQYYEVILTESGEVAELTGEWVNHTKELEEQKIWAEGFTKGLDR